MKKKNAPNFTLLGTLIVLNLIGIAAIAGASIPLASRNLGQPFYFLFRHIFLGILPGGILAYIAFKTPLKFFKKYSLYIFLFAFFLIILVFVPGIGESIGGARRWINLRIINFQPSELFKLSVILYLSAWLTSLDKKQITLHKLIGFLVITGVTALIFIFQPDMSTLGVILLTSLIIYSTSKAPWRHIVILILLGIIFFLVAVKIAPYRMSRLLIFLNPEKDPLGEGYHIKQAFIAVGSGGILGKGLGLGQQKYGFLPQPISDSIFANYAEETGFIGSLILVILFIILIVEGFRIAKNLQDEFGRLVAVGITSWFAIQAFVNIGSMIGLLPLTGIPLPFVSYGCSALIAEFIGAGILLNLSKMTK